MHSMDETAHILEAANLHRAVGAHNLNEHSSRSHAICTLQMEQRLRPGAAPGPDAPRFLRSKLHLVDLAGELVALSSLTFCDCLNPKTPAFPPARMPCALVDLAGELVS